MKLCSTLASIISIVFSYCLRSTEGQLEDEEETTTKSKYPTEARLRHDADRFFDSRFLGGNNINSFFTPDEFFFLRKGIF